jgi:iron complex outermembrane receptor protein
MHNQNLHGYSPEDNNFNGLFATPGVALVRAGSLTTPTTGTGQYNYLNAAAGCRGFPSYILPAAAAAIAPAAPSRICEIDHQALYQMLQPEQERKGLSARLTFNIGDRHQLYAIGNYYQTDTHTVILPSNLHGTPTPPNPAGLAQYNVMLPVYVCSTGVGTPTGLNTGCNAFNGVLNPQNPFAAQGRTAQILMRAPFDRPLDTSSRALRGVIGISGSFGDEWNYTADFTASTVQLDRNQQGYIIPQRVADAAARGEINFFNPDATPQSVWDSISPDNKIRSSSDLWQATATLGKSIFELPGGPLQVAVGVAYRHEAINAPSANPVNLAQPYTRYIGVNSVGTSGSRNVRSAFAEISAPILDQLEFQLSGRYDKYSTGQKNFSPKAGVKFTPIPQLALRATWTKGFRAPSFNESFGLPTTGYVTQQIQCTTYVAFCAQHGGPGSGYASGQFAVGLTSSGNPDLSPEKSTTMTAGLIFEPIRNVSFTVDLWRIKVRDLIVGVTNIGPFIQEYYNNNGVVNAPGVTVTPGIPNALFPNATPHIGFIETSYANADNQLVQGIDFGVNARFDLMEGVRLTSSLEASYLHKNRLTPRDLVTGELQDELRYEDSLSPCNVTSCSGSPAWRGSWQNTVQIGDTTVSATAYYTKGVDVAAADYGATYGDCESAVEFGSAHTYANGDPVQCRSPDVWNVDLTASHRINDKFTIYANVLNVLDIDAPFDPNAAYGLLSFNPAWAGPNVIGRYFRVGAKVDF